MNDNGTPDPLSTALRLGDKSQADIDRAYHSGYLDGLGMAAMVTAIALVAFGAVWVVASDALARWP